MPQQQGEQQSMMANNPSNKVRKENKEWFTDSDPEVIVLIVMPMMQILRLLPTVVGTYDENESKTQRAFDEM